MRRREQTLKLKLERSCSCPPTGAADLVPSQAFYLLGWAAFLLPRAGPTLYAPGPPAWLCPGLPRQGSLNCPFPPSLSHQPWTCPGTCSCTWTCTWT